MLVQKIKDGEMGIAQTVAAMIALSHDPETTQEIRDMALWIMNKAGAQSDRAKAQAIYNWMVERVAYNRDPVYREYVQPPLNLLKLSFQNYPGPPVPQSAGDCDDHATAIAALLSSAGFLTRFVVTAENAQDNFWSHIYTEVLIDDKWVPVDSSMWFVKFGERVGAKISTYIYPDDIDHDGLYDARKSNPDGLGFIQKVVSRGSSNVLTQMRRRQNHPHMAQGAMGLGWVSETIQVGGAVLQTAISAGASYLIEKASGKTKEKLEKIRSQTKILLDSSQTNLKELRAKLQKELIELEKQQQFMLDSEKQALRDLVAAMDKEKYIAIAIVAFPLVTFIALQVAKRRERRG